MVECLNRTLRDKMHGYMTRHRTKRYIDDLNHIVKCIQRIDALCSPDLGIDAVPSQIHAKKDC